MNKEKNTFYRREQEIPEAAQSYLKI